MKAKNVNPKTGKAFQWNGLLIEQARFGYVIQEPNNEKHLYWYNCEVDRQKKNGIEPCVIPAIEILAKDEKEPFCIANIAGVGIMKLEAGGMWTHPHLSLDGQFYEDENFAIYEYSQADFAVYQKGLENWQRAKDPQAWERLEGLRKTAIPKPLLDASGAPIKKNGTTIYHEKFRKGKK